MSVVCALFNIVPMFSAGQPSKIPEGAERYSYGEKDTMVPYSNSVELYEKLKECGVDCELITYENSDHMLMEDAKEMIPVREKVFCEFADRYL